MAPFYFADHELAERETRKFMVPGHPTLSKGWFLFVELYCALPGCDCKRVMINVIRERDQYQLATINYAFEPNDPDRGPFLDPLNPQSEISDSLLDFFKHVIEKDAAYKDRLQRHYLLFKQAIANPRHPIHERLQT